MATKSGEPLIHAYISGPMRGIPNLNRDLFYAAQERCERAGMAVFNPADEPPQYADAPMSECMRKDISALLETDVIVLLPGWQQSEGARQEVSIARVLDLDFMTYDPTTDEVHHTTAPELHVEGIDQEARRLVYGERAATYGHPRGDFAIIAGIWSALLQHEVTVEQVALCMAGLKLARLAKSPSHRDSQVDTIGYMLCLARLQEDPAEIEAWANRTGGK